MVTGSKFSSIVEISFTSTFNFVLTKCYFLYLVKHIRKLFLLINYLKKKQFEANILGHSGAYLI